MAKSVEIIVLKRRGKSGGGIKVEAHGYQGQGCEPAVNFYAEKLGPVTNTEKKPEYYQTDEETQKQ